MGDCYIELIKSSNTYWVPVALQCTRIWGWAQAVGKHLRAVKIHHCCKSWIHWCFPQHYTDVPHILRAIALNACAFGNNCSTRDSPHRTSMLQVVYCIYKWLGDAGGTQGEARDVASSASRTVCLVLVPKKRLCSDAGPQQRLRRSNPGQEILQLLSGTLPLLARGLGASQHLISLRYSQELASLSLEGNPSLAKVPGGINMHFWVILNGQWWTDKGSLGKQLTLGFCLCQGSSVHNMIAVSGKLPEVR